LERQKDRNIKNMLSSDIMRDKTKDSLYQVYSDNGGTLAKSTFANKTNLVNKIFEIPASVEYFKKIYNMPDIPTKRVDKYQVQRQNALTDKGLEGYGLKQKTINKRNIKVSTNKGIQPANIDRFVTFGKNMIHYPKLHEGIFNLIWCKSQKIPNKQYFKRL
jgi:hypothetical protein